MGRVCSRLHGAEEILLLRERNEGVSGSYRASIWLSLRATVRRLLSTGHALESIHATPRSMPLAADPRGFGPGSMRPRLGAWEWLLGCCWGGAGEAALGF